MKKILLPLLISILLVGMARAYADTYAPPTPYKIMIENDSKFFYMSVSSFKGTNGEIDHETELASGLYYNTTPPINIYLLDFSTNTSKNYPLDYAYSIMLSSDGLYFVDTPWATQSGKNGLGGEAISFYLNGTHVKSYTVEELLKDSESAGFTASHVFWEDATKRSVDEENHMLSVTTLDNNSYTFCMLTGEIK
jgi:hypothetical protein